MSFASSINLSSLNGASGFRLDGVSASDGSGVSVASAGDVNGDGLVDLIIGASGANGGAGRSYIVFGQSAGFTSALNLSALDGTNGFRLDGISAGDGSGGSVAAAGDINGDGFGDLLIGASTADAQGTDSGAAYIVLGKSGGFASSLSFSSLIGSNGAQLWGNPGVNAGNSVAAAGDVNGDGFADIILGVPQEDQNGNNSGMAVVRFGSSGVLSTPLGLNAVNGTNGFALNGSTAFEATGYSVASAGDVNGDGFADVIVGVRATDNLGQPTASPGNSAYVLFGASGGIAASLVPSALNGTNGFRLVGVSAGDNNGISVASAGDVNGDGFADLIVGAAAANGQAGRGYVVFGASGGFTSSLALSALNGGNGFRLDGVCATDRAGTSVAAAGDINGDGFADLIVGAAQADPNGANSGSSYVVFGKSTAFTAVLSLSTLTGANGFRLDGVSAGDGAGVSVAAAGDVDGDGFADLIIGAAGADPGGNGGAGSSYIYYSPATGGAIYRGTSLAETLRGTPDNDVINGFGRNDRLFGNAGNDAVNGGTGDDTIDGGAGNDTLDGGTGNDTLTYALAIAGVTLSLAVSGPQVTGGSGTDSISNFETLIGGAFNDSLTGATTNDLINGGAGNDAIAGGDGNDTLTGGAGDDTIEGGLGNDSLDAGADTDTLSYASASSGVTVSLGQSGAQVTGGAGTDTATNFENLTGGGFNDSLTGTNGDNVIDGGGGNDTILGGNGNDLITAGANDDNVEGGAGNDTLDGGTGNDTLSYASAVGPVTVSLALSVAQNTGVAAGTDTISNFENLVGGAFADRLTGSDGDNVIEGGANIDTIDGGLGNDTLDGGASDDTLSYASATGAITFSLALSGAQVTGGAGTDTASSFENLTGGGFNDSLTGSSGTNSIDGGEGDDMIIAGEGVDTLNGGLGNDMVSYALATLALTIINGTSVSGAFGNQTLQNVEFVIGTSLNDSLRGSAGDNGFDAGDGNDTIDGQAGNDTLLGGLGNDTILDDNGGNDSVEGGGGNDTLGAGAGNDVINGGAGDDIVNGGPGNDTLDGGDDLDTLSYVLAAGAVTVNLGVTGPQVTGGSGTDTVSNFENLLGSSNSDILTGSSGDNVINGEGGHDTIDGGAGNDTLDGGSSGGVGTGDVLSYASATAGVTVDLSLTGPQVTGGAGTDTVSNFERLQGSGFNDRLSGALTTIDGGAGDDTISGGAGGENLSGGDGIDTVSYANAASAVRVNLALTTFQNTVGGGNDTLSNFENLTGGAFNDTLTGSAGDNVIEGGLGNDTLLGRAGADSLIGGGGLDFASYAGATAGVTARIDFTNLNTGEAAGDSYTGIGGLTGTDFDDTLVGTAGSQILEGGFGNDALIGRQGSDSLTGGFGVDFFAFAFEDFEKGVYDVISDFNTGGNLDWFVTSGVVRTEILALSYQGGVVVSLPTVGYGADGGGVWLQNTTLTQFWSQLYTMV